jgi:protein tyrosine phosphatase (PTP) superfamily phosphohydrolase (DUF442 family)
MKRAKFTILIGLMLSVAGWTAGQDTETPMIDIPNALVIGDGILGGGQPDEIALRVAADSGYRTILNMRGPGEEGSLENEEDLVRSLGMDYIALPISGGAALNEKNAKRLAEILAEPSALPVMVHCASGNRVGILFGVKAFYLDGLDGPAALEYGKSAGARRIPEQVLTLLAEVADD